MTLKANTKEGKINVNRYELTNIEQLNYLSVQPNAILTIKCKLNRINIQMNVFEKPAPVIITSYTRLATCIPLKF